MNITIGWFKIKMINKVFVTGGTEFVGSRVINALLAKGFGLRPFLIKSM